MCAHADCLASNPNEPRLASWLTDKSCLEIIFCFVVYDRACACVCVCMFVCD